MRRKLKEFLKRSASFAMAAVMVFGSAGFNGTIMQEKTNAAGSFSFANQTIAGGVANPQQASGTKNLFYGLSDALASNQFSVSSNLKKNSGNAYKWVLACESADERTKCLGKLGKDASGNWTHGNTLVYSAKITPGERV